ncbi:hypothetical protein ES703_92305 [subsurface metagenome]
MDNNSSDKTLLSEQVHDLQKRTKAAIESCDSALFPSLLVEYAKLLNGGVKRAYTSNSELSGELLHELVLLSEESKLIPPTSKNNPLVELKWLDNSISKLLIIVKRLYPVDTTLELKWHPKVLSVSGKLFQDGHYPEAIFAAFKSLEAYVKKKSGVKNKSGKDLMAHVFSESNPILKIKCSLPDTAKEEQEGFKFIFMGAMVGIRNPKAHYEITQRDRARTSQYLALASLLFKTVDDATL